jgi:hypothetical protein
MPLDLFVPDLVPPIDAPPEIRSARFPHLETWLARADLESAPASRTDDALASLFDLPAPVPVAPVSLLAEDGVRDGCWLRVDPVHVRIERDMSILHAPASLDISRAEADALVDTLQAHFRGDGLEIRAPSPERWYVRVPDGELPETTPLADVTGRNVEKALPVSRGKIRWASLLTEAQMLLAAHGVNARRESERRPAINSVWFWGGGAMPAAARAAYGAVYADGAFARGLAQLSGARLAAVPGTLEEVSSAPPAASSLVVMETLSRAVERGDAAEWVRNAGELESRWFAHLGAALRRFTTIRVILPGSVKTALAVIDSRARWRLWRARKAIGAYA